jgi:hypothetical protein
MKINKYFITNQDEVYIYEVIVIASNNKIYKNVGAVMDGELTDDMELIKKDNVWYLHTFDKFETNRYIESGSIFREVKDTTEYLHLII